VLTCDWCPEKEFDREGRGLLLELRLGSVLCRLSVLEPVPEPLSFGVKGTVRERVSGSLSLNLSLWKRQREVAR
jgi:hypothetical protein